MGSRRAACQSGVMCGKFTAQASWRGVVDFSQPLTGDSGRGGGGDEGGNAETITYRLGGQLPVIIWHAETKRRFVVPMRWVIPDKNGAPKNIHARAGGEGAWSGTFIRPHEWRKRKRAGLD